MRRVVITGIGIVSPLGCNTELVWKRLLAGECGITKLQDGIIPSSIPISIAAMVPRGNDNDNEYDEVATFGRQVKKEIATFSQYAISASDKALKHAKLDLLNCNYNLDNFGVSISNGGIGSTFEIIDANNNLEKNYKKLSPYFVPKVLTNMAAGQVSIRHDLRGPLHSVTTACAAGLHSIGDSFNFIRHGSADAMLAGGTEASVDPLAIAGFARMNALSISQDPLTASKPFDKNRNGFVIGEGSCVLVLEELNSALDRNAPIIAEICGYGLSGDAYKATSPSPDGRGAQNCMRMAIKDAGIKSSDVGYLNAHSTSTPVGDSIEVNAIENIFNNSDNSSFFVSSTKGSTGHLLGAAGALEAAFTVLALRDGLLPPTINLDTPDPLPINFQHISNKSISYEDTTNKKLNYAMKNSFGFGGFNASVVFKRYIA